MPLRWMAVRNGCVSSVPKPMCGPGGVADDVTLTSLPGLQGKHKQAIFAKKKRWSAGSSTSSGVEEKRPRDQEEEVKKLRAKVKLLRKQQRAEKGPDT